MNHCSLVVEAEITIHGLRGCLNQDIEAVPSSVIGTKHTGARGLALGVDWRSKSSSQD